MSEQWMRYLIQHKDGGYFRRQTPERPALLLRNATTFPTSANALVNPDCGGGT